MRELAKEVEDLLQHAVPSKAVYTFSTSYGGGIRLSKVDSPSLGDHESLILGSVRDALTECLDLNKGRHFLSESCAEFAVGAVRTRIRTNIIMFLAAYQDTKNNKLTTTYRWYHLFLENRFFNINENFENDMYNVFKYLNTLSWQKGSPATQGVVALLTMLKGRYENTFKA